MNTHAEVALPAGGNNIIKATKSVLSKKHISTFQGQITVTNCNFYISCFQEAKRETDTVDRRVYYTLCRDIGLTTYFDSEWAG